MSDKSSRNIFLQIEEDRLGMRIQSETVELTKDEKGIVGISIGVSRSSLELSTSNSFLHDYF